VTRAHRYDPQVNRTYQELAAHYGCAVLPARPFKPRDTAKAEAGVLLVERWILARRRARTFTSLAELNAAIRELLEWLNARPFKRVPGSRRSLFEALERPALRPLPAHRFEFATWQTATVPPDYHLAVDRHWYRVPSRLVGQRCEVRLTAAAVEVFCQGQRVASHLRSDRPGGQTTDPAHRSPAHRRHLEGTPGQLLRWAAQTGPATAEVVAGLLRARPHPAPGRRAGLGVVRLGGRYGAARLEAACRRALALQTLSSRSVESIQQTGPDQHPMPAPGPRPPPAPPRRAHPNVRGAPYYH
jgi:transposase